MKKSYHVHLLTAMLLFGFLTTKAQEEKRKDLNREMTLEREYDPTVQDTNKVNTLPVVKEPTVIKRTIDYAGFTLPADPEKEITRLASGNIMTDISYNNKRGYLHFGGGSYLNLDGDFGYHILNTDKNKLNLWFSHRSTNGNVKFVHVDQKEKSKINDNLGGIDFRHVFDKVILNAGVKYGYSAFNYYGFAFQWNLLSSSISSDQYKIQLPTNKKTNQADQVIRGHFDIRSAGHSPFGYLFGVDYTHFSHKYGKQKEQDGIAEQKVGFDVNLYASKENFRIGVDGRVEILGYSQPSEQYIEEPENSVNAVFSPYLKLTGENRSLRIGAKALIVTGIKNYKTFALTPDIIADMAITEKTVLYGKVNGNLHANSMYEIAQINRYANPVISVKPSRDLLDAQLGVKSHISPGFWFNVFGGYRITDNDFFFVNPIFMVEKEYYDYLLHAPKPKFIQKFSVLDTKGEIDTKRFYIGADLKYSYQQLLDIQLKGIYNNRKMENEKTNNPKQEVIGRPKVEINAGITLRPMKNLSASLDYYLATGRKAETKFSDVINLKNISELNLTGNYTLNDTFGIYLKLKNILFRKQELYFGYPLQNFGAMIGFNINF